METSKKNSTYDKTESHARAYDISKSKNESSEKDDKILLKNSNFSLISLEIEGSEYH